MLISKAVLGLCAEMGERLPEAARRLAGEFPMEGEGRAALARIVEGIEASAGRVLRVIRSD